MMEIKTILFDADDTLYLSFDRFLECNNSFYIDHNFKPHDFEMVRKLWGKPFKDIIAALFPDHFKLYMEYSSVNTPPVALNQALSQQLQDLQNQGYFLGIVSNGGREWVRGNLKRCLPDIEFNVFQSLDDWKFKKPNPLAFHRLFQKHNLERSSTVFIGDSISDYEAARKYGIRFRAALTGAHTREEFRKYKLPTEHIFENVSAALTNLTEGNIHIAA